MHFKNDQHRTLFEDYATRAEAGKDREYLTLCYLLAAISKDLSEHINPRRIAIRSIQAVSSRWSSGEKALVKMAINIFTDGGGKAQVNEVFRQFDSDNFRVAMEALRIRYERV